MLSIELMDQPSTQYLTILKAIYSRVSYHHDTNGTYTASLFCIINSVIHTYE